MVILFIALFIVCAIADALRDAWVFDNLYDDGITDFIDADSWHPWKNVSRACGWIAFYVLAISGAGLAQAVAITGALMPGTWAIWQMVYNRSRFQRWFVEHDFNLTALTMIKGKDGIPLVYRLTAGLMRTICLTLIAVSAFMIYFIV